MSPEPVAEAQAPGAVSAELGVERWTRGALERTTDLVAEEVPVALVYHDVPHVVMLATPADLEDYAVGFTLSEGLVARAEEIRGVEVSYGALSADVRITVAWERFTQLLQRRRNLTGRTGCGLCGAERDRKSTRLNSSHRCISYAVFCLKKKKPYKRCQQVVFSSPLHSDDSVAVRTLGLLDRGLHDEPSFERGDGWVGRNPMTTACASVG